MLLWRGHSPSRRSIVVRNTTLDKNRLLTGGHVKLNAGFYPVLRLHKSGFSQACKGHLTIRLILGVLFDKLFIGSFFLFMTTLEPAMDSRDVVAILNAIPGSGLILLPDAPRFTIVGATDSYLADTYLKRDEALGRGVFEALTDDPQNSEASGVKNLTASLSLVLESRCEHRMANQRYDIFNPATGAWEYRSWRPLNRPLLNQSGEVQYIIHWVEDVTEKTALAQKAARVTAQLAESESRFRRMIEQAPVAITLTRGQDVVIESVNAPMLQLMNQSPATQVTGKKMLEVLPELDGQAAYTRVQQVQATGEAFSGQELPVDLLVAGKMQRRYFNFSYTAVVEPEEPNIAVLHVAVDVTDQVQARKKIEQVNEELQMAIEVADLGTFLVDLSTNTATFSERIRDWLGLERSGQDMPSVFAAIHPGDRRRVVEAIQKSTSQEEESRHDLTYRVFDRTRNKERHLRSIGKTLFDHQGKACQISGVIQDVTVQVEEQRRGEENEALLQSRVRERTLALETLNGELKRSNSHLEEFAHAASHDLKEPIRKVQVFTGQLIAKMGQRLSEEESLILGRIETASARMRMLVDDLMFYSYVSIRPREAESVDLREVMTQVLEDLELDIADKSALVAVGPLPVVSGYRRQLQQLFQNLLSNALKYSKAGVPPQVEITASNREEDGKWFHVIEVTDNGIGFKQEYASQIFHLFTRLHAKSEYSGTGIGLSIVKKIVENHNGTVTVESKPGKGTSFYVHLPVG